MFFFYGMSTERTRGEVFLARTEEVSKWWLGFTIYETPTKISRHHRYHAVVKNKIGASVRRDNEMTFIASGYRGCHKGVFSFIRKTLFIFIFYYSSTFYYCFFSHTIFFHPM